MANVTTNNVQDLDFSVLHKKQFRIKGLGDERILELDTSDLSVINRLEESQPKLKDLEKEAEKLQTLASQNEPEEESEDELFSRISEVSSQLRKVDSGMRELVDYIFDTNASEVLVQSGTMYDIINGMHRYEIIIDTLIGAYEADFTKEADKLRKRTTAYVQDHKRKRKKA